MFANEYHFVDRWRVRGSTEEVTEIIDDPLSLPRWWGSVYLEADQSQAGDERGIGRVFSVHAKGWLPYTLRLQFTKSDDRSPNGFGLDVTGDLIGRGVWTFEQDGAYVDVSFDWRVHAAKVVVRRLSFLLKPLFESNHRWTMRRGEESLRIELDRRHATTPDERALIPEPPKPVAYPPAVVALGAMAGLAAGGGIVIRLLRSIRKR